MEEEIPMEKLQIARLFMCFPLIGMLMPDVLGKLTGAGYTIPMFHLLIELSLVLLIITFSVIIYFKKRNTDLAGNKLKNAGNAVVN